MERFFNTEGPCKAEIHYVLPPLARISLPELEALIAAQKYFVLHAPRQTGKTTCLLALMNHLNQQGRYRALYVNIEGAQAARGEVSRGMASIIDSLADSAQNRLEDSQTGPLAKEIKATIAPESALTVFLRRWCKDSAQPIILLLDEVDALVGDTLISLLRQLRAGYIDRPAQFPQTVILCGVRDVRDYRIHTGGQIITGGSAFNIKAESVRLGDFDQQDIAALYQQHTVATGQVFEPETLTEAWRLTCGQPWLVNALAYETCFRMVEGKDRARPVTAALLRQAAENLILRRDTHLDQLVDKLREERVRRVIQPLLAGSALENVTEDDLQYLVDLGLIRRSREGIVVANAIYKEVLPRALNSVIQDVIPALHPSWLTPEGRLDIARLMESFVNFWRQHGEPLMRSAPYHEIAPHLVLLAFLQRVTNGEGTIEREYAIGSGRMDICLRYAGAVVAIELKVWRDREPDPLQEGLTQLDAYLTGLGLSTGWLVIFDRREGQPPLPERTRVETVLSPAGRSITVIRG